MWYDTTACNEMRVVQSSTVDDVKRRQTVPASQRLKVLTAAAGGKKDLSRRLRRLFASQVQIASAGCSITGQSQHSASRHPAAKEGGWGRAAARRDETRQDAPHTPIVLGLLGREGVPPLSGHRTGMAAWLEVWDTSRVW